MTTFLTVYVWFSAICCVISMISLATTETLVMGRGSRVVSLLISLGFLAWAWSLHIKG